MLNPSALAKKQIVIHLVNLLSNVLSTDPWSCRLRRKLLSLLGNRFGEGTVVWGGSYFGGGKLTTGSACFINRSCHFDFNESITLGSNVVVGHHVTFITAEHQIGDTTRRAGPLLGRTDRGRCRLAAGGAPLPAPRRADGRDDVLPPRPDASGAVPLSSASCWRSG